MIYTAAQSNIACLDIVLEAFRFVDIKDFIPKTYAKYCSADIDIVLEASRNVVFRKSVLVKIFSSILENKPESILIIGDITGYSTAILSLLVSDCYVPGDNSETAAKLTDSGFKVMVMDSSGPNMTSGPQVFDAIYLDSGLYSNSFLSKIFNRMEKGGAATYLRYATKQYRFCVAERETLELTLCEYRHGTQRKIFETRALCNTDFLV